MIKIRVAQGGPLNRGGPCHGIIGINPALPLIHAPCIRP